MDETTAEGMARRVRALDRWRSDPDLYRFLEQVMTQNDRLFLALAGVQEVLMRHFTAETAPDDVAEVIEGLNILFKARLQAEETVGAFMMAWGRDN